MYYFFLVVIGVCAVQYVVETASNIQPRWVNQFNSAVQNRTGPNATDPP